MNSASKYEEAKNNFPHGVYIKVLEEEKFEAEVRDKLSQLPVKNEEENNNSQNFIDKVIGFFGNGILPFSLN